MANNPWTNPTHPTAVAAMNRSHQRVYLPVTQNVQQPQAPNNPWASHQPLPQAWAPYPSCYPMVIPTVIPAVIPCVLASIATKYNRVANTISQGFPPMQYPGSSPASQPIQFYSAQVQSPMGANYSQGQATAQVHSPAGANYYQGQTAAQVNANNQARAQKAGAYNTNIQMVPQPASPNDEFWCRELTGHYTLRTMNTIMHSLQPGVWAIANSGYPYFVRHAKS